MAETGIPAADAIQAGFGAIEGVVGLINAGKTKREAAKIAADRPDYSISPLVGEDLSLANSELANGMGTAAERAYRDLNNSQFSTSLNAILRGGGDVNSIGDLYGNNQEGRLRLAQMQDQLRLNQIQNRIRASQRMQDEQQTQWQLNEFAPWQDRAQANAAARQGAQQQINAGLNAFGGGVMNASNNMQENRRLNDYFKFINNDNGINNLPGRQYIEPITSSAPPLNYPNTLTPMQMPSYVN